MVRINKTSMATPFSNDAILDLQKRKKGPSGITYDLKAAFDTMAKKGLLKTDGKFTKQEAKALYNKLVEIHKKHKYSTNFTKMNKGETFEYTAQEYIELAEAAGYSLADSTMVRHKLNTKG